MKKRRNIHYQMLQLLLPPRLRLTVRPLSLSPTVCVLEVCNAANPPRVADIENRERPVRVGASRQLRRRRLRALRRQRRPPRPILHRARWIRSTLRQIMEIMVVQIKIMRRTRVAIARLPLQQLHLVVDQDGGGPTCPVPERQVKGKAQG